ncbi:MAG: HEAT repeat domain-containing protein [Planctomycetes bacterium]|nr:HEAT repeat domain-containing protein [Planctomycetota bacterium]
MKSKLLALALALGLSAPVVAQEEPPIETMRATARERVKEQAGFIKQQVVKALIVLKNADEMPERRVEQEQEALVELGLGVLPALIQAIQETDSERLLYEIGRVLVRLVAEKRATVAEIGDPLRDLLDQKHPARAAAAVGILGYIKDLSALDAIRLMVSRDQPPVRAAAIEALARLGDESVRQHYAQGMAHEDPKVRRAVMRAARLTGDVRDVEFILAGLQDKDQDVVLAAIRAIEGVGTNSTKAMRALHDQLAGEDENRVRTAIEVIGNIGNRNYSVGHLGNLVENANRNWDLRKTAAIAMYRLGSSEGMDLLAKGYEQIIRERPKDPTNYQQLAEFYEEFGAWGDAAKIYDKAIDLTRQPARQNDLRLLTARAWARAGQFKKAAALLKKTPRNDNWQDLADDPAFEKMKEDRRYRANFER